MSNDWTRANLGLDPFHESGRPEQGATSGSLGDVGGALDHHLNRHFVTHIRVEILQTLAKWSAANVA